VGRCGLCDEGEEAAEELADVGAGGESESQGRRSRRDRVKSLWSAGVRHDGGTSLEVSDAKTKTGSRANLRSACRGERDAGSGPLGRPRTTRLR